jgi:hypothetical protein
MLIVLLDPALPSCQRFMQLNADLPCRRWNVRHPLVKRHLDRSPRGKAIQSLPTVIEVTQGGAVAFYTHEQAFIHAQTVRDNLYRAQQQQRQMTVIGAPSPVLGSLADLPGVEELIDLKRVGDPNEGTATGTATADESLSGDRPVMFTTDSEIEDAMSRKPKEATATELAAQMRLDREAMESKMLTRPGGLPPPPSQIPEAQGQGQGQGQTRKPTMSVSEILGAQMSGRNPDPPGLGMEPTR